MKNKYVHRSKISEARFRLVVKGFSLDLTATQTADLASISRNATNRLYIAIRKRIVSAISKGISPSK